MRVKSRTEHTAATEPCVSDLKTNAAEESNQSYIKNSSLKCKMIPQTDAHIVAIEPSDTILFKQSKIDLYNGDALRALHAHGTSSLQKVVCVVLCINN